MRLLLNGIISVKIIFCNIFYISGKFLYYYLENKNENILKEAFNLHEIWNWFKGLFSGGKIQSNIGKANTNNSIDGNNNFSSGNIEVGNGSAMGNNSLVKNYIEQTMSGRR